MALDPSIILQAGRGVTPLMNPAEIQDAQMQRELGGMKLAQARQAMQDDAAYRQTLQSGTSADLPERLYKAGLGKQAQDALKFRTDQQKATTDQRKTQVETGGKLLQAMGGPLKYLSENPSLENADAVFRHLASTGIMTPEHIQSAKQQVLADPSPEGIKKFALMGYSAAVDADKKMTDETQRRGQDMTQQNSQATNTTSRLNNADTVAATNRSTDQRADAANKGQVVQSDDGPILVDTRTGAGKSITGPSGEQLAGVTKPLNDSQSKSLLFGSRMRESDKILNQLNAEGTATSTPFSQNKGLVGGAVNAMSSGNQQMLNQAKLDFMSATLRRESGAAISEGEYAAADKQYFPQIGDSKEVIAQKSKNRQLAINGVLSEVPEKQRGSLSAPSDAAAPAGALSVTDAASYAKVPSGATYTTPDGKTRRKP